MKLHILEEFGFGLLASALIMVWFSYLLDHNMTAAWIGFALAVAGGPLLLIGQNIRIKNNRKQP